MEAKHSLEAFENYIKENLRASTASVYVRDTGYCIRYMGEEKTYNATYQDIMDYVAHLRSKQNKVKVISRQLASLKCFYSFLIEAGYRTAHPCKNLNLKDNKTETIQLQDLFKPEELERLLERKERFTRLVTLKNKVMMSLLIYQALRNGELAQIKMQDLDLEKGTIYVRSIAKSKARTLPLKSQQVMLFYKYIYEVRPKLLALSNKPSDHFIINLRGLPETGLGVQNLVESFQHYFPNRKLNSVTIRQSVIANLLKEGKDIRLVQEFAGHTSLTTTEKYRENNLNELQNIIQKYHPLQ